MRVFEHVDEARGGLDDPGIRDELSGIRSYGWFGVRKIRDQGGAPIRITQRRKRVFIVRDRERIVTARNLISNRGNVRIAPHAAQYPGGGAAQFTVFADQLFPQDGQCFRIAGTGQRRRSHDSHPGVLFPLDRAAQGFAIPDLVHFEQTFRRMDVSVRVGRTQDIEQDCNVGAVAGANHFPGQAAAVLVVGLGRQLLPQQGLQLVSEPGGAEPLCGMHGGPEIAAGQPLAEDVEAARADEGIESDRDPLRLGRGGSPSQTDGDNQHCADGT